MTNGVGTPFYMAPEMATSSRHYTAAVDVYSFGIMAAQTMAGHLKYDSDIDFDTQYGLFFFIIFQSSFELISFMNPFFPLPHLDTQYLLMLFVRDFVQVFLDVHQT